MIDPNEADNFQKWRQLAEAQSFEKNKLVKIRGKMNAKRKEYRNAYEKHCKKLQEEVYNLRKKEERQLEKCLKMIPNRWGKGNENSS